MHHATPEAALDGGPSRMRKSPGKSRPGCIVEIAQDKCDDTSADDGISLQQAKIMAMDRSRWKAFTKNSHYPVAPTTAIHTIVSQNK
ncbi:hypothetical protein Y032_0014g2479 [Ancylostoma ceylanicum]|uniref:Uncharacterized protein n=1 Tax=Ancylostoma ceylanicum TaxID=53326 RepID=A0A016VAB0_9BILA|nr:hypothetical protein Y032_0014g2479 [Ancylostoma ceylanicum]